MAKSDIPSAEILGKLLRYDSETGVLTWLKRDPCLFADGVRPAAWRAKNWNSKNAGKPAFTSNDGHGYKVGAIFGKLTKAHIVVWVMMTGHIPAGDIDHRNGDRADNRWCNLREASRAVNLRNAKKKITNSSGYNGVHWMADRGMWRASITINSATTILGNYGSIDDAIAARAAAELGHGFTERHGI